MTVEQLKALLQQEAELLDEMEALVEKMAAICEEAQRPSVYRQSKKEY